jgi:type IV secretory pathway VirB2 component (pilin)
VLWQLLLLVGVAAVNVFGAGAGLPWENPIRDIARSVSGPVAYGLGIGGIALAGGSQIFSHLDLGDFGRRAAGVGLVTGVIMGGSSVMALWYGAAGAVI